MYLTIDFYEPEWHNHRIVCQCYVKPSACRDAKSCVSTEYDSTECADDAYIEKHIPLTELERYIADVYHYTGQYYDSNLEEYFDKEDWDSVLYDLEVILNRREDVQETPCFGTRVETQDIASLREEVLKSESLPDMPVIIRELIMVRDVA